MILRNRKTRHQPSSSQEPPAQAPVLSTRPFTHGDGKSTDRALPQGFELAKVNLTSQAAIQLSNDFTLTPDQSFHKHQQSQAALAQLPAIQMADYPHGSGEVLKNSISSQQELKQAIEDLLDHTFAGVRALFMAGGVATTVESWGDLLHGLLSEDNDMGSFENEDCADVVETIKAENRKEEFLRITEFYGYFNPNLGDYPYSIEQYKEKLARDKIYVEDKDNQVIQQIYDSAGDREALAEDPKQSFLIGSKQHNFNEKELKNSLNELLGETVNWGHEITDCMGDAGKKGELYYYQVGKPLTAVGSSQQSHASSKGGKTIIWETSNDTIEILAIGKHTTRGHSSLSKGASYEISATFGGQYSGYTNKILGFKS